jgi:hypothetical protein
VAILTGLRTHIREITDSISKANYFIAVASGTPQMHACWVLLAASGEIPARLLNVRPPRFVSKDRPLVFEVDLSATEFPLVRANICSIETPDVPPPDIDTVIRELAIVGEHPAIRKALEIGAVLASSSAPILIMGATGTGKELFARFIHRLSSRLLDRFVPINCAAIPSDLVESILFGHKKGSFTGAMSDQIGKFDLAGGGTLFLDELAELPMPSQAKLLRILQDGLVEPLGAKKAHKVNVRVIAATNQDLRKAIQRGRFREDLFYRLNVGEIRLPALRERKSDVPKMALHVLDRVNLIRKFKREEYPQVAVSVGMLDTGSDCREVLHLVMCRRVRSPILYQQMRGRGTRTAPHISKQKFVIYDFFGNHDYFNDSDTDTFTGTGGGRGTGPTQTPPKSPRELIELGLEDEWLEAVTYVEVGPEGERIDKRDYVHIWETTIQVSVERDPLLQKIRDGNALTEDEEQALAQHLNNPELYFNEENLRRAYRRPGGTLIDFIRSALGDLKLKSRDEELTENFQARLVSKNLSPQQAQYLSLLKNCGIVRGKIEVKDLFQPPLSILNAAGLGVELFGERGLKNIIEEMNESVFTQRPA